MICEIVGGRFDGVRVEMPDGAQKIAFPVPDFSPFRARSHDDFMAFIESWDGPRDADGFPTPRVSRVVYALTDELTRDGAVIFR